MTKTLNYGEISLSPDRIFLALGINDPSARAELRGEVVSALDEIRLAARGRLCFDVFPISRIGDSLDLGFSRVASRDLSDHLDGCGEIALVVATAGLEIDRLITKYSRISPSRAVILQAAGGEFVEELLDRFENGLRDEGYSLRPRFSCGYGDLPLSLQKDIFSALGCEKSIGVYITDSLLMTPTKSVSAIIGIEQR